MLACPALFSFFFFFNDTATTEIYTLSLHDALPIWCDEFVEMVIPVLQRRGLFRTDYEGTTGIDRKSTRLNSSHVRISYAVFCLKKKKTRCQETKYYGTIEDSQ